GGDDEAEGGEGELAEVLLERRVGDGDDEVGDGLAVDVVELEVLGDRRARPGRAAGGDGGAARIGEAGGRPRALPRRAEVGGELASDEDGDLAAAVGDRARRLDDEDAGHLAAAQHLGPGDDRGPGGEDAARLAVDLVDVRGEVRRGEDVVRLVDERVDVE